MKFKDLVWEDNNRYSIVKISKELNIRVGVQPNGLYYASLIGDFTKSIPDDIQIDFYHLTEEKVEVLINDTRNFKLTKAKA